MSADLILYNPSSGNPARGHWSEEQIADYVAKFGTVEYEGRLYLKYEPYFYNIQTGEDGNQTTLVPSCLALRLPSCIQSYVRIRPEDAIMLGNHSRVAKWNVMKLQIDEVSGDYHRL